MPELHDLLQKMVRLRASDLHITVGTNPVFRIDGKLVRDETEPVLSPTDTRDMVFSILSEKQRKIFEENLELDFSYGVSGLARFRINAYVQKGSVGAAIRLVPFEIKKPDELGLPPVVATFAEFPRGLVLVTGPTGTGKTTTLASIINLINETRSVHIMTIEDPIEFLHKHKKSVVNQREVGSDTLSFASALKHCLRQDPDVILVGEMRDLETMSTAITAAETGHLVFATLHTQDAPQTIDRVIDVFPPHQQQQIRIQLASSLQAVCSQQLLPRADGKGRVCAAEILIATPAVRNLIREGKTHQLVSIMQTGAKFGMQTMDQSLASLYKKGLITREAALERSVNRADLERLIA